MKLYIETHLERNVDRTEIVSSGKLLPYRGYYVRNVISNL